MGLLGVGGKEERKARNIEGKKERGGSQEEKGERSEGGGGERGGGESLFPSIFTASELLNGELELERVPETLQI